MEQSRKKLKTYSIIVLIFTVATIFNLLSVLIELNNATIPEDAPSNILLITRIILIAVSSILLLPQIYIGVKGLKIAKKPNSSKAHIVVATILFVFSILGVLSPITSLFQKQAVVENIRAIIYLVVEMSVYFDYIKWAKNVAKGK